MESQGFVSWALSVGYSPSDIAQNRAELLREFSARGRRRTHRRREYVVKIELPDGSVVDLGKFEGRERAHAEAALAWVVANGEAHGLTFDEADLRKVRFIRYPIESEKSLFEALSDSSNER